MILKKQILLIIPLVFLFSCKENSYLKGKPDKTLVIKFQRFEKDIDQLENETIDNQKYVLNERYAEFFTIYNEGILRFGDYQSVGYNERTLHFLTDSIYNEIYDTVAFYFPKFDEEEMQLSNAFRNYKMLFPKRKIPQCYTHISGFRTPIVVGDSVLSVSLEHYLGADHVFYKKLGTYTYLLPSKNRENIAIDAMRGWLVSEFPSSLAAENLLNNIIHEGKLLFIQQLLMPDTPSNFIVGLTEEQYAWCDKNEMAVWQFMIEKKHLFSTKQTTIAKYLQNGPFFNFFGQGSSPLVGKYIGWQIVNSYMSENKDISIDDLLKNSNGQEILSISGYKPK